jgi:Uma2 family endonuclease
MYPDTDGKPMAENTVQARWIVLVGENLRASFPDHFIATDLLWYPIEGRPDICAAPDALVALGRPPHDRLSYRTWREGGTNPQVVVEIWSESNDARDKARRLKFFDDHGVQEVYGYDPDDNVLTVWWRVDGHLAEVPVVGSVISPALGVRFEPGKPELRLFRPDGERFRRFDEIEAAWRAEAGAAEHARAAADAERERADAERERAEQERGRAEQERERAEHERERADAAATALADALARLRAAGLT